MLDKYTPVLQSYQLSRRCLHTLVYYIRLEQITYGNCLLLQNRLKGGERKKRNTKKKHPCFSLSRVLLVFSCVFKTQFHTHTRVFLHAAGCLLPEKLSECVLLHDCILTAGTCKFKGFFPPLLCFVLILSSTTHSTQGCKIMFAGYVTALSSRERVCVRLCVCVHLHWAAINNPSPNTHTHTHTMAPVKKKKTKKRKQGSCKKWKRKKNESTKEK